MNKELRNILRVLRVLRFPFTSNLTNVITILMSRYYSVNKISKYFIQNTQYVHREVFHKYLNIFASNFIFGDAATISADILTSSCSFLSYLQLRSEYSYFANHVEREREREKEREDARRRF